MKILKLSVILAICGLFVFACSRETANTTNTNVTTTNGTVIVSSSPTVSFNASNDAGNAHSGMVELASAQKIYSEKCIKCHKEDGTGGKTDIEGTTIKAPNFTTDKQKAMPDSEYIDTIEHGAKEEGMPAYKGKISDDDIKNLVKYIRKNFQGKS